MNKTLYRLRLQLGDLPEDRSREKIAGEMGISPKTLYRAEKGRNISDVTKFLIVDYYKKKFGRIPNLFEEETTSEVSTQN